MWCCYLRNLRAPTILRRPRWPSEEVFSGVSYRNSLRFARIDGSAVVSSWLQPGPLSIQRPEPSVKDCSSRYLWPSTRYHAGLGAATLTDSRLQCHPRTGDRTLFRGAPAGGPILWRAGRLVQVLREAGPGPIPDHVMSRSREKPKEIKGPCKGSRSREPGSTSNFDRARGDRSGLRGDSRVMLPACRPGQSVRFRRRDALLHRPRAGRIRRPRAGGTRPSPRPPRRLKARNCGFFATFFCNDPRLRLHGAPKPPRTIAPIRAPIRA